MTTIRSTDFQQMLQLETEQYKQLQSNARTFATTKAAIAQSITDEYGQEAGVKALQQIQPEMIGQPMLVERPHADWTHKKDVHGKYYHTVSFDQLPLKGKEGADVSRLVQLGPQGMAELEEKLATDPKFRAAMQKAVGGKILNDSFADGVITVERNIRVKNDPVKALIPQAQTNPMLSHTGSFLKRLGVIGLGAAGGAALGGVGGALVGGAAAAAITSAPVYQGLQGMEGEMRGIFNSLYTQGLRSGEYAKDLEFEAMLNNPGADMETLFALFSAKVTESKEREIKDTMKQINDTEKRERTQADRSKTGSTLGGVIGMVVGSVVPGVGTMIGGSIGKALGGGAASMMNATENATANTESSTLLYSKLQLLMQKYTRVVEMMSNLTKKMADTHMAIVRNLR